MSVDSTFVLRTWAEPGTSTSACCRTSGRTAAVAKLYGVFDEDRGMAIRGTFIIDKSGVVRWKVVNPIPQARDIAEYQKALAELELRMARAPGAAAGQPRGTEQQGCPAIAAAYGRWTPAGGTARGTAGSGGDSRS